MGAAAAETDSLEARIVLPDELITSPYAIAAGLSALARVPAPTIPFSDAVTSHAAHRSHDDRSTSFMTSHVGNKTYEWDEGGDGKELGTDAMGTSSKGDHRSGFFGMHHPSTIPDSL